MKRKATDKEWVSYYVFNEHEKHIIVSACKLAGITVQSSACNDGYCIDVYCELRQTQKIDEFVKTVCC